MSDPIGYWMGQPISEMSREELLGLIQLLSRQQQLEDSAKANEEAMWASIDRMSAQHRAKRRKLFGIF